MRWPPAIALAAGLALSLGCRGCGSPPPAPPERFVPAGARAAVIVPGIDGAAADAGALLRAAASFPGAAALPEAHAAVASQLGLDPVDPRALERAGIDASRGAALAWSGGKLVLVLPVRDRGDLVDLVARLARDRAGATSRATERVGGVEVSTFGAPGREPAAALAFRDRTALLASGPGAQAAVAAAASLEPAASLDEDVRYRALRRALGEGRAAIAFLPPGAFPPARAEGSPSGAMAAAVEASEARLTIAAAILPPEGGSFADLAAGPASPAPLAALAPAAATAAWNGDPGALARRLLPLAPARDREWLAARGIDLQRDVFDLLGPGAAGAASLAPGAGIAALSGDVLRTDPIRLLRFEAVAPLRDAARAREVSARIARLAGARPGAAGAGPSRYRVRTRSGEIAWEIDAARARIALAGGAPGGLDALLGRLAAAPAGGAGAGALAGGLGGLALDVPRLVESVRALPPEAFGEGPNAFVLRSVVDRFVAPAEGLAAVSLRADLADGALRLVIEVEARAAGTGGPR
ncbi:MAG TPA: hypothetical protein VLS93_06430 [Anaeromyxobacteraceae bacterium]|nr:hypothetical protein [Anaeromyxobacteraceae bacterium]